MSKFNEFKIKFQDSINQWYENFNDKAGYIIWKLFRTICWVIVLCVIPFLPLAIATTGYPADSGVFDATMTSWGFIVMMVTIVILFISLAIQWWFSKFRDYKDKDHEN